MAATGLVGKRYGRLVVTRRLGPIRKGCTAVYWECRCDCGESHRVITNKLLHGNTRSCGCLRDERRFTRLGEGWVSYPLNRTRQNARTRGLEFSLTWEECKILFSHNCHYCGCRPNQRVPKGQNSRVQEALFHGIDRVDSSLGYVPGNVVTCCKHCNTAKGSMSTEQFMAWVRRIYNHLHSSQKG